MCHRSQVRAAALLVCLSAPASAQFRPIPMPDSLFPGAVGHRGHMYWPKYLSASANGELLLSSDGETIIIWDPETAKPRKIMDPEGSVLALEVSPDGRRFAVARSVYNARRGASVRVVHVLDIASDEAVMTFSAAVGRRMLFSPDGQTLVGALLWGGEVRGGPFGLVSWDLTSGTELGRTSAESFVDPIRFTADGKDVVAVECCETAAAMIKRFPATLQGPPRVLRTLAARTRATLSPRGDVIALASMGNYATPSALSLVDAVSGEVVAALGNGPASTDEMTFSHDGSILAAYDGGIRGGSGYSNDPAHLYVWDAATRGAISTCTLEGTTGGGTLLATPAGIWLAASGGARARDLQLIDPRSGKVSKVLAGEPDSLRRIGRSGHWRITSMSPVRRDSQPPPDHPRVKGAGRDREYWTIELDIENHREAPANLQSPSEESVVRGLQEGGIALWRSGRDVAYPLVYLVPLGGGSERHSMSMSLKGQTIQTMTMETRLTLKPHERARVGLVFVVPRKEKERDLGLFFMVELGSEYKLIPLGAPGKPPAG